MGIRERIQDDPVVWFLGTLVTGFLSGLGAYQGTLKIMHLEVVPEVVAAEPHKQASEVLITTPQPCDQVQQFVSVTGRASGLAQGQHLWVAVHPVGSLGWWPQLYEIVPASSGGTWEISSTLGSSGDVSKRFEIGVILANDSANSEFSHYLQEASTTKQYPERPLPLGAVVLTKLSVTRQ